MATGPDLRIGDADREAAAATLREHYAQGRLTLEEFNQRLDAAFAATTQSQLRHITRDLPHVPAAPTALPVASSPGRERSERDYQSGGWRPRLGLFPVIIAALASWLLIFDLHLRMFPWPGKLAIFLAILAGVRGVLRRVLGLGRGRGRFGGGRCGRYTRGGRYSGGSRPRDF
jgi:Domain of unknown function (DUF1707)